MPSEYQSQLRFNHTKIKENSLQSKNSWGFVHITCIGYKTLVQQNFIEDEDLNIVIAFTTTFNFGSETVIDWNSKTRLPKNFPVESGRVKLILSTMEASRKKHIP